MHLDLDSQQIAPACVQSNLLGLMVLASVRARGVVVEPICSLTLSWLRLLLLLLHR